MNHYIAVDIGASSGRLIHGWMDDSKLQLQEIHRFKNGFDKKDGHDRWNIDRLVAEILTGLEKVKANGVEKTYLGIDTWAVDYVLVDKEGEKLADPISYRDIRTKGKIEEVSAAYSKEKIYEKTGIQFLELNTLYQLHAENKERLQKAEKLLFIPDYIGYKLTGKQVTEVTNASTSQMMNLETLQFDKELMELTRVSKELFAPLTQPGTLLGKILKEWHDHYNIPEVEVITVASHDTASAVVGTPAVSDRNWAYLSSGTWSLIGIETKKPLNTKKAFNYNFTNEWGAYHTYRFLKNIMGLWMVQEIKRLYSKEISFAEMAAEADKTEYFTSIVDVNDTRFTNPKNMIKEIQEACLESKQPVPKTIGELVSCVYSSLAKSYQEELQHIEEITGNEIEELYIVGGGSNIKALNQLTANLTKKTIYTGPSEATAIGNLLVQMIATNDLADISKGRELIKESFEIHTFKPKKESKEWLTKQM